MASGTTKEDSQLYVIASNLNLTNEKVMEENNVIEPVTVEKIEKIEEIQPSSNILENLSFDMLKLLSNSDLSEEAKETIIRASNALKTNTIPLLKDTIGEISNKECESESEKSTIGPNINSKDSRHTTNLTEKAEEILKKYAKVSVENTSYKPQQTLPKLTNIISGDGTWNILTLASNHHNEKCIETVKNVNFAVQSVAKARMETIFVFRRMAEEFDEVKSTDKGLSIGSSATSIAATCVTIAGGVVLMVGTAGIAAPVLLGVGAGVGVASGVSGLGTKIFAAKKERTLKEMLSKALMEDLATFRNLKSRLKHLNNPIFENATFSINLNIINSNLDCINIIGGKNVAELIGKLLPCLDEVKLPEPALGMILEQIIMIGRSFSAEADGTDSADIIDDMEDKTDITDNIDRADMEDNVDLEGSSSIWYSGEEDSDEDRTDSASVSGIKEGAKITLTPKFIAKAAASQGGRKIGSKGLSIGFGAIFMAWDSYDIYKKATEESLGSAMRRIAQYLEDLGDNKQKMVRPPPVLLPDEDVGNCMGCNARFSMLRWKNHCRGCGLVFCKYCLRYSHLLPHFGYKQRVSVCKNCDLGIKQEKHAFI